MRLSSLLLFIFLFLIKFYSFLCLWKNSKDTLENYIIDVLFTNSLTIIRCNPYESHIFRVLTVESIGHIKCSNRNLFLPENHIEYITLLQWNSTTIKCNKKKTTIEEERTYFNIKHKAKNAFKKIKFDLIRVGSTGPSELHINEKKFELYFKHPKRQLAITNVDQKEEGFSTDIFSFKNRPILCRERYFSSEGACSNTNQHQNLSYICYYKVCDRNDVGYICIQVFVCEIGVPEPPTIAEMEDELNALPNDINPDEISKVDFHLDRTPLRKSSWSMFSMIGIFVVTFIIIVILAIGIYFCCCRSGKDEQDESLKRTKSDSSNVSNTS